MAKQRGPVASTFSGRVGNVVGAKLKGGEYVTRAYQPSVKNPRTLRQQVSRMKLAVASALGAVLAQVVKVGYAAASGSTRMYPRNMFIKDIVPVDAGVLNYAEGEVTIDYTKLVVSAQAGIAVKPAGQVTAETGGGMKFIPTNAADVELFAGESLGVCVCLLSANGKNVAYRQGLASAGVSFTAEEVAAADNGKYYAFYKVIPASANGIASETQPWMYPSRTSASVQVFTQA